MVGFFYYFFLLLLFTSNAKFEIDVPIYMYHNVFIFQVIYGCIFTRGQFGPSGIVVACVCLCVRPSVCAVITCLSA